MKRERFNKESYYTKWEQELYDLYEAHENTDKVEVKENKEVRKELKEIRKKVDEIGKQIEELKEEKKRKIEKRREEEEKRKEEVLKRKPPRIMTAKSRKEYDEDPEQFFIRYDLREKLRKAKKVYQEAMEYQHKNDYDLNKSIKKLVEEIERVEAKLDSEDKLSRFDTGTSLDVAAVICQCEYDKYVTKWTAVDCYGRTIKFK